MKELNLNSNYIIHKDGKIFSKYVGRFLVCTKDTSGYRRVKLRVDGRDKKFLVHRLVASTFIPNPDLLDYVNHLDGNKHNNVVSNLEWCTSSDNQKHAFSLGLKTNRGEINPRNVLTEEQVLSVYHELLGGRGVTTLADSYGVSSSTISSIKSKQNWSYLLEDLPDCVMNSKSESLKSDIVHIVCKYFEEGLLPKQVQDLLGDDSITLNQLYDLRRRRGFKDIVQLYNW